MLKCLRIVKIVESERKKVSKWNEVCVPRELRCHEKKLCRRRRSSPHVNFIKHQDLFPRAQSFKYLISTPVPTVVEKHVHMMYIVYFYFTSFSNFFEQAPSLKCLQQVGDYHWSINRFLSLGKSSSNRHQRQRSHIL